ncbi:MAG: DUF1599 domain-containing protein [Bacteroidales bacterium]|nr:DUF1599 domain-containing protein [Bacteroidales bacterium]
MSTTNEQFDAVTAKCRGVFSKKLHDYGAAWRILRIPSVTDQLFIKANRIRNLEIKGESKIQDNIADEFMGIINYAIVGLIQLQQGSSERVDINPEEALTLYDEKMEMARQLMLNKNFDYEEAWRGMRISSYTDLILMKINRVKQIEDLGGHTLASEGIDSNYLDMLNYAAFGLIRLGYDK